MRGTRPQPSVTAASAPCAPRTLPRAPARPHHPRAMPASAAHRPAAGNTAAVTSADHPAPLPWPSGSPPRGRTGPGTPGRTAARHGRTRSPAPPRPFAAQQS